MASVSVIAGRYRALGYNVERVGHGGSHFDGGIDLKLRRGAEYIVVQCKRENVYKVTHNVGHELLGVMCTEGATGAIVVNAGEFTSYALTSAKGDARLILVDGQEVRRWFPELALPHPEPVQETVAAGGKEAPPRRVRSDDHEGKVAIVAMAALIALAAWQCSRSPPEPPAPAQPATGGAHMDQAALVEAKPVVDAARPKTKARIAINDLSPEELAEWKRGNAESMKILSETTPELPMAPQRRE